MAIGSTIGERYRLVREIGRGGMATVYLASDPRHRRDVALKMLHAGFAHVGGADRFVREIRTTAGMQHPHILPLYDSGVHEGVPFYVMPYVEGETLADRLKREGRLPVGDAVDIALQVADALGYAHGRGIIHRDIKPANILLGGGHAIVADFGIAHAVTAASDPGMTETGLVVGTVAYMSPEQSAGDRALDGRSDVYALGCVLHEMLAGAPPFTGSTPHAVLAKRLTERVPDVRTLREGVPDHVAAAIRKALARSSADRFATVTDFSAALRDPAASAGSRRHAGRRIVGATIGAAGLVAVTGWMLMQVRAPSPAGTEGVRADVSATYARGVDYMARLTQADLDRAIEYFGIAIEEDSAYAPAWAGLSWAWIARQQMGFVSPAEATPMAVRAANRAVTLDSLLPEAHYAVAVADGWAAWDWETAEAELRHAIALRPGYADARNDLSHVLLVQHRVAEAVAQIDSAVAIDPESVKYRLFQAAVYVGADRLAEARALLQQVLDNVPNNDAALTILAGIHEAEGRLDEAVDLMAKMLRGEGYPAVADVLTSRFVEDGIEAASRAAADSLTHVSGSRFVAPLTVAGFYASAHEVTPTLEWLERGLAQRDPNLPYVGVTERFRYLYGNSRFEDILRSLHLPTSEAAGA